MSTDVLLAILSSTVISGIISAAVSLFTHFRDNSLHMITEERQKWRDSIRNICTDIQKSNNHFDFQEHVADLKNRINPLAINSPSDYQHDGHVWELIETVDALQNDTNINNLKMRIIAYLSCMLKFDWERSKKEILGNRLFKLSIVAVIIQAISILIFEIKLLHLIDAASFVSTMLVLSSIQIFCSYSFINAKGKVGITATAGAVISILLNIFLFVIMVMLIHFSFPSKSTSELFLESAFNLVPYTLSWIVSVFALYNNLKENDNYIKIIDAVKSKYPV